MHPFIKPIAADILSTLYSANTMSEHLISRLQDIIHYAGPWYKDLAAALLIGLENMVKEGTPMGGAMKFAYEKATKVVGEILYFGKEHPVFCALVALGILIVLAPLAIEALGFAELGPIEGTFAALWQARYAGYVPAGSLFSFFQRMGMVWRGFAWAPAVAI